MVLKKIIMGGKNKRGSLAYLQTALRLCGMAVFVTLILTLSAKAILPEKQYDFYRSITENGMVMLPSHGHHVEGAAPQATNKAERIKVLNNGKGWRKFVEKAGPDWFVRWNMKTGTPHLAVGTPMELPPWRQLTEDNIENACKEFISAYPDLLAVDPSHLHRVSSAKTDRRWHVTFEQTHNDVPIYGSSVYLGFTDDKLTAFGSDVYANVDVNTAATVGLKQALEIATADCTKKGEKIDRTSDVKLIILPLDSAEQTQYSLCWKLDILQSKVQKKWQYFIDAKSGEIVTKRNTLWYAHVTGEASGEYKNEFASDPTLVAPFENEKVTLEGQERIIKSWDFNSDPGWTAEGGWAFGQPAGIVSDSSGCADPCSGYTGSNVYGFNLSGDYKNDMQVSTLTTTAVDCSSAENVRLKFMRWLGVEANYFDHAAVQVSNNEVNWITVWKNETQSICDGGWVSVYYDISSVAAFKPTVYVRWVMGPTDNSITFPGWNIDDVKIVEVQGGVNAAYTNKNGKYKVKLPWDNSTLISEIKGLYCDVNYAGGYDANFIVNDVLRHDSISWVWDSSLYNVIDESNVYWHINHIHNYYKQLDPHFTGLDYPVPAEVYVDMDNAYWDGQGLAFGTGDGVSFDSFGLYAQVIYHEYTHGVTQMIYGKVDLPYAAEPGAMNEGWSDYFGVVVSPSQSPKIGGGGLVIGDANGARTLENDYRRETDWANEVHADSQMFSGSLWEARKALGPEIMDKLVHFALYAHALTFEEYLLALLAEDDAEYGDGNLSNGTPHGQAIFTAFGHHGIGGLQYVWPSIVVHHSRGNSNSYLEPGETARFSLTLQNGWAKARNVYAHIDSNDPYIKIAKGKAAFGMIAYGMTADNTLEPFVVSVRSDCPETHTFHFTLTIAADGPYKYQRQCLLYCSVATQQMAYDDGGADDSLATGTEGGLIVVKMTPEVYPCYPTHIRLYPKQRTGVTLVFWDDDDPNGMPGKLLASMPVHPPADDNWFDVDITSLGLAITTGSIYAGWAGGSTVFANGLDNDPPYYERTVVRSGEKWYHLEDFGYLGNLMIRLRYVNEPPMRINPPYKYTWCPLGEPVSLCLSAANGTPPYYDWTALPLLSNYSYGVLDSSLFAFTGTAKNWHSDDHIWNYTLPFSFPYYGSNYSSINISSNGFMDFGDVLAEYANSAQGLIDNIRIAPLWKDLTTYEPDDIYIDQSAADRVTIRWQGHTYFYETPVNFAAVLFSDGRIRFDYGENIIYSAPTVGISAGNGADYAVISGYTSIDQYSNAKSILFTPVPPRPSLPAGLSLDSVTGCLSGTPDAKGTYNVTIQVTDSSAPPKTVQSEFVFYVGQNPADLNGDCKVNLKDFSAFAKYWQKGICGPANNWCWGADINKSGGWVDITDLTILAENWLDSPAQ